MKVEVRVTPRAKRDTVLKPRTRTSSVRGKNDGILHVRVTASPVGGRANKAVIGLLAEHFRVPKSAVHIVRGVKSRSKLIEIDPDGLTSGLVVW